MRSQRVGHKIEWLSTHWWNIINQKCIQLHTLNEWVVWDVIYVTIKLLGKKTLNPYSGWEKESNKQQTKLRNFPGIFLTFSPRCSKTRRWADAIKQAFLCSGPSCGSLNNFEIRKLHVQGRPFRADPRMAHPRVWISLTDGQVAPALCRRHPLC